MVKRILSLCLLTSLTLVLFITNAYSKGNRSPHCFPWRKITISIAPDKPEYKVGQTAVFDIKMAKRWGKPVRVRSDQIVATFPNQDTQVTLTPILKGHYAYTTLQFEEPGTPVLSVTVYSKGNITAIKGLERTKERLQKRIEWFKELKERIKRERFKRVIDRIIARYEKIIQRIDRRIERLRQKGIIGFASCAITVIIPDTVPPVITNLSPPDGAILADAQPAISCSYSDDKSGIDVDTVKLTLDAEDITSSAIITDTNFAYTPAASLSDGLHTVKIEVSDNAGNKAEKEWSFTIKTVAGYILEMEEGYNIGNWEEICEAAWELGEMGGPAVSALVEEFKNKEKDETYRKMIAEIISHIKSPNAVEFLIEIAEDPLETSLIRAEAISTLGEIGNPGAYDTLIVALCNEDESIRSMAALSLGDIGDIRAVEPLISMLNDPSETVRIRTIRSLGELGDKRATAPLVVILTKEGELSTCIGQAALALGKLEDSAAVEPLLNMLEVKPYFVQISAMKALGMIKDERAVEPLIAILQGEDEYLIMNAGMALAEISDERAVEPLQEAIERVKDEFVKTKLKEAYKKLTGEELPGIEQ